MEKLPVSFDDIIRAQECLQGAAHRTPTLTSSTADDLTGARLFFKCENFQRMGAFKFRGGYNALSRLTPEQKTKGVLTFSSGNHAQAVALSAKLLGLRAAILMPYDSPAPKVAATKGYGAEVIFYDRYKDDREALAAKLSGEQGFSFISPYDHAHVIAGQGTAAKELIEDAGALDALLVPLGGGGLLSGCAVAAKAMCPNCAVYGVEPETGNDGQQSFKSGKIVHISTPKTIADGAQTQHLGQLTFAIIKSRVDDILTATDAELVHAMRFFTERMKIVVEPTGALAAAAVLSKQIELSGKRVGIIISGGNVELGNYARLLTAGA